MATCPVCSKAMLSEQPHAHTPTRPEPFDPRDYHDPRYVAEQEEERWRFFHPEEEDLEPAPRRLGCIFTTVAFLAIVADVLALILLVTTFATPRSAIVPTATLPGSIDVRPGSAGPSTPTTGASGGSLSGAAHGRVMMVTDPGTAATPSGPESSGDAPSAAPPEPMPRASGPVEQSVDRTAISSGLASWYQAEGDVASVPWWRAGQDPVVAVVEAFHDGRAYSVTVLITGWCACLSGQAGERLIDLSAHAFAQLAALEQGLVLVQVEIPTQGPVLPATDQ